MKLMSFKKVPVILLLALGFFLLFVSLTLLNKPPVNQGVQTVNATSYHNQR